MLPTTKLSYRMAWLDCLNQRTMMAQSNTLRPFAFHGMKISSVSNTYHNCRSRWQGGDLRVEIKAKIITRDEIHHVPLVTLKGNLHFIPDRENFKFPIHNLCTSMACESKTEYTRYWLIGRSWALKNLAD